MVKKSLLFARLRSVGSKTCRRSVLLLQIEKISMYFICFNSIKHTDKISVCVLCGYFYVDF